MAGIDKAQVALLIDDEIAAELTRIVAMRDVSLFPSQPGFEIHPASPQGT